MKPTQLSIKVTAHSGEPIAQASVTHTDEASRATTTASTDEHGYAYFSVGANTLAHIRVAAQGYGPDERLIGGDYLTDSTGVELFILGPAEWPAYYRGRIRVPFQPIHQAVGIQLDEKLAEDHSALSDLLDDITVEVMRFDDPTVVVAQVAQTTRESTRRSLDERVTRRSEKPDPGQTNEQLRHRVQELGVGQVGSLVKLSDDGASFLTDTIIVSLLDKDTDVDQLAARHGLEVLRKFSSFGSTYIFRSPEGSGYDLLDRVADLNAERQVRYAEPDLIHTVIEDAVTPNHFLFPQQWDHPLIDTPQAWEVLKVLNPAHTFGDPDITIAVVDSGIDANHPAMAGNLSNNTAKVAQLFDFSKLRPDNDADGSDHGMACASAATSQSNNGRGSIGVAGNCQVIGIHFGGSEARYAALYRWAAGFSIDDEEVRGGEYPAQLTKGADVITSSFGVSAGVPISGLMRDTFDLLTDQGRGGLGTLLFFSAGNANVRLDDTFVRPWGMYERCHSIAASTLARDGVREVKAGYSNFGTSISFCAPSSSGGGEHNPTVRYGAFTATRADRPGGAAIPGAAVTTTTLAAPSVPGATSITVADVTGAEIGGALLVGSVVEATSRGRRIIDIDPNTRVITFEDPPLRAAFERGTSVVFGLHEYRSNFGGTSYATPVTAGTAALMLSANPQLSWQQVGDILADTAVKIDATNTSVAGRWRDTAGRESDDPNYSGPAFSEWYGAGRIDAAAAVTRAAWAIDLATDSLEFLDIPEGETTYRVVRFNVRSLHRSTFSTVGPPTAPFSVPVADTVTLPGSSDYSTVQEAYLWVAFTGESPGSSRNGSIIVGHDQSGQQWTVPITANTVRQKTASIMLVLDRSGSMNNKSGVGNTTRMDVLKYSAGILIEAAHEGDSIGIVSFDHEATSVVDPPLGPLNIPTVFDPARDRLRSAIDSLTARGRTSIGSGLELGQSILENISDDDVIRANIVFTDGYENEEKWISEVTSSITDQTYAVAMGSVENIKPANLIRLTNGTGGYCVLTDELNSDSRFKLAKYFLQVLAGVNNDQIILDPPVQVSIGETVEVPFELAETDVVVDVVLLTQYPHLVQMTLVTPDGDIVDEASMNRLTGKNYRRVAEDVVYFRLTLPAPIASGAHAGTWQARFHLSARTIRQASDSSLGKIRAIKTKTKERVGADTQPLTDEELKSIEEFGISGTLLIHASSNLRMNVELRQRSFEPRTEAIVQATLTEYGVPITERDSVKVTALVTDPQGETTTIDLPESTRVPGLYAQAIEKEIPGIWTVLIRATGETFRGSPFTREMVCSSPGWKGGDNYKPGKEDEPLPPREPSTKDRVWQILNLDRMLVTLLRRRLERENLSLDDLFEQPSRTSSTAQTRALKIIRSDKELAKLLNRSLHKENLSLDDLIEKQPEG